MMQVVEEKDNLRIRLDHSKKLRLDQVLSEKNISLQDAMEGLVLWALDQDDIIQSIVFGQFKGDIAYEFARLKATRSPQPAPLDEAIKAAAIAIELVAKTARDQKSKR